MMTVPMIRVTDTVNWTTTRTFRGREENRPALKIPFKTLTGWEELKESAGYDPAVNVVTAMNPALTSQNHRFIQGMPIRLSASSLNHDSDNMTRPMATTKAKTTT